MRPILQSRRTTSGSVLALAMMSIAIVGMALAAYLTIVREQNRSVIRSMVWNNAIPIAEAGVEEALAQLNTRSITNFSGWTATANGFQKRRELGDGFYVVTLQTNLPTSPVILATGYAPMIGVGSGQTNGDFISRTIRVTTRQNGLYARGLVAKSDIVWNGNIFTDSFDSLDPNYSNAGRYDPLRRKDNGSVGANDGSVYMGGGKIYGNVSTGPTGSATNGTVGDFLWVLNPSNSGDIQEGRYNNDMNLQFPDVQPPFSGGGLTPGPGTVSTTNIITTTNNTSSWSIPITTNRITGVWTTDLTSYPIGAPYVVSNTVTTVKGKKTTTTTYYAATNWYVENLNYATNVTSESYTYVLDSGNYYLTGLSMSGQQKMLVRGNAILYVNGPIAMAGQSQIDIRIGASLKIYVAGNVDLKGNGVMNANNDCLDFSVFGLPTCTSFALGGNASFTGTIYAPQAAFTAGGGGNDQYDCVGAVIAYSISMNGHFSFHYDEALGRTGPSQGFVITSWNEE